MPHFIVEYTSNIKAEARIPKLLAKANEILIAVIAFAVRIVASV